MDFMTRTSILCICLGTMRSHTGALMPFLMKIHNKKTFKITGMPVLFPAVLETEVESWSKNSLLG